MIIVSRDGYTTLDLPESVFDAVKGGSAAAIVGDIEASSGKLVAELTDIPASTRQPRVDGKRALAESLGRPADRDCPGIADAAGTVLLIRVNGKTTGKRAVYNPDAPDAVNLLVSRLPDIGADAQVAVKG